MGVFCPIRRVRICAKSYKFTNENFHAILEILNRHGYTSFQPQGPSRAYFKKISFFDPGSALNKIYVEIINRFVLLNLIPKSMQDKLKMNEHLSVIGKTTMVFAKDICLEEMDKIAIVFRNLGLQSRAHEPIVSENKELVLDCKLKELDAWLTACERNAVVAEYRLK